MSRRRTTSSSEFESNIAIMVDQFPQPRGREHSQFLRVVYKRCMSTRISVVLKVSLIVASVVFITGWRPWASDAYVKEIHVFQNEKANELLGALYELDLPTSRAELTALNEELADLDPSFILKWSHHLLSSPQSLRQDSTQHPLVQVTSFGPTGIVILQQLSKLHLLADIPTISLDTLYLFKESYAYYDTAKRHFNDMKLTITKPISNQRVFRSREEFDDRFHGLWKSDPNKYTKLTKQDPLEEIFKEWNVKMWITGRRRSQGGERAKLQILEFEYNKDIALDEDGDPFDYSKGRWKLNPLAYWNYDQVWSYIKDQNIPYNPLYDQGYTSVGDEMTTRLPDMSMQHDSSFERSGRFVGLNQTECGLHSHRAKINAKREKAAAAGEEWKVPTLSCEKCIDLTVDTFDKFIRDEKEDLLLEFYSPYCGSCQEFAPVMDRLTEHLSSHDSPMKVARFDITQHDPPLVNEEKLFEIEATPTLYRVKYNPSFGVELYTGEHDYSALLRWLKKDG